jgi:hypothetical protein
MLSGSENWARSPPIGLPELPEPSSQRSMTTMLFTPASAKWNAMLAPITPPPMITTSAAGGTVRNVDEVDKGPILSQTPTPDPKEVSV